MRRRCMVLSPRSAMQTAALAEGRVSTMSNSLSEDYLRWLAPQIRESRADHRTYDQLLSILFEKEFVWLVPNDDNRVADGLDLRPEFCYAKRIPVSYSPDLGPCSFLEVLIGLSRRLSFIAGGSAQSWAWQLAANLKLDQMSDPLTPGRARRVEDILDRCIWRRYRHNGRGGFFPLMSTREDQTKVELWYQMSAYIDELGLGF